MNRIMAITLAAAATVGLAGTAQAARHSPEEKLDRILAGRVAGTPRDCIDLLDIRSTRIIDRTALVYDLGGVLWVNRPKVGASMLREDDIPVSRSHNTQLCSLDTLNLINRTSQTRTGFASLGAFVPYARPGAR